MEEIIALLQFAVDNEHRFTEHDPDGVKRGWFEQARKALASVQTDETIMSPCPYCLGKRCERCDKNGNLHISSCHS